MPRHFLSQITIVLVISFALSGCATQANKNSLYAIKISAEQQVTHSYCYKFLYGDYATQANYQRALHWCKQGALAGVAQTQTLFAEMHFLALGLNKNLKQALYWYIAAAKQVQAHAQFMLHHFYSLGLGLPADHNAALDWLHKAAMQGHIQANALIADGLNTATNI